MAIAKLVEGDYEQALSAQALAVDTYGGPRTDFKDLYKFSASATDELWLASIQLEAGDFAAALSGYRETGPKLIRGSQGQCHALAGILFISEETTASAARLAAEEIIQSLPNDPSVRKYLSECLAYGARWTLTNGYYHSHFWFAHMLKKIQR